MRDLKKEYIEQLIYGKSDLSRIVSIEVEEDKSIIYTLDENLNTVRQEAPNKFWILGNKPKDRSWVKLQGDLHFKFGRQFTDRETFLSQRNFARKTPGLDTYSIYDPVEACMVKDGYTFYKDLTPKDVPILSFDIEATGLLHNDQSKVLLISNTFRKGDKITRKMFCYDEYENQGELIKAWCDWVREVDPSVLCGHNIFCYDIPYLAYCASRDGYEMELGRNGSAIEFKHFDSNFRVDGNRDMTYRSCNIYGREIIDTMFMCYRIPTKNFNSYALKSIIAEEGLEVEDRQHYDASQIRFKYTDPSDRDWET